MDRADAEAGSACSYPGARSGPGSQAGIERGVDVAAQLDRIDAREAMPALEQGGAGKAGGGEWPQLGDGPAGPSDGHALTARDAVDNLAASVSEVSDAHSIHELSVSRMIHQVAVATGFSQRSSRKRAKSVSAEHTFRPCSIANAANWASEIRLPRRWWSRIRLPRISP